MSIDATTAISPVLSQIQTAAAIQTAVARKTMDAQKVVAEGLVSLIPPAPPLTTSGSLGTRLNVFG